MKKIFRIFALTILIQILEVKIKDTKILSLQDLT